MSINIGSYHAEGPLGNDNNLQARSGVYVILGRRTETANWSVVDVGESENIRERVSNHDRAPCWCGHGHAELSIAKVVNTSHAEMVGLDAEIKALTNQKRGLMQKLLTGKWRVEVSNDEEAAA